jgi:hypothetical protein
MSIHTFLEPGWMWTIGWLAAWAGIARIAYPPQKNRRPQHHR